MNINFWKFVYFVFAAAGLALCLYFGDYVNAALITFVGFMVAQS